MWVELYMQNEIGDFQVMSLIRTFSELFISQDFPHISDQLIMLVDKRIVSPDQFNRRSINTRQTPPCLLAKNVNFKKVKLVDMDCLEVARQLTLMDFELFIKIQPTEFIQQAWSLKSTNNANQNINKMIQFSNRITQWVSVTLLLEKDLKKRGNLLKFFINLADKLKTLNSLNSLMAIIKALNCPGVHRLNRTWSQLPTKSIVILDALKRMMDPTKHLLNYKEYLRTMQNSSCVPFLGFYLSELTGIQDAYSDTIMSSKGKVMIHFDKRVKIGQVIHGIQNYQSVPFAIYMHDEMAEWLDTLMQVEGCDLMSQSLILEPKEREDDKISRLLLESGFL